MIIAIALLGLLGLPAIYGIRQLVKEKRRKEKQVKLAMTYERLLLQNKFIAERYDVIGDSIVALDRKNKKLAVVDFRMANTQQYCLSLLTICETKIIEQRGTNDNIRKIALQLKQKRGNRVYEVCFFDAAHDAMTELPRLAKQALYWKTRVDIHKRPGIVPVGHDYML